MTEHCPVSLRGFEASTYFLLLELVVYLFLFFGGQLASGRLQKPRHGNVSVESISELHINRYT